MVRKSDDGGAGELAISLSLPAPDSSLFARKATDPTLTYLARHPYQEVSISELAETLSFSTSMIVRAVDQLVENDLVVETKGGSSRTVRINRDRLSIPGEPYFQIPQTEFQKPVHAAVQRLTDELEGILAVVLFGSVARGEADRRSDIDLWILVDADRATNQRTAMEVKRDLDEERFDGDRYTFHIDVESVDSVPAYTEDIQQILGEGIVLEREQDFRHVENFLNQAVDTETSDE